MNERVSVGALGAGAVCGLVPAWVLGTLWVALATMFSRHPAIRPAGFHLVVAGAVVGVAAVAARGAGAGRLLRRGVPALLGTAFVVLMGSGRAFGIPFASGWILIGLPALFTLVTIAIDGAIGTLPLDRIGRSQWTLISVRLLRTIGYAFFLTIVIFPFYFMVASSLKPRAIMLQNPTNLSIDFGNGLSGLLVGYQEVLVRFQFARYILNSTFVATATVFVTLVPAILGAYAVTRLEFRGREWLSRSILLIYMFPAIVLVIPLYSFFSQVGLRNTLPGLLVVYPAMTIPVALYMLRSYFLTLPKDIEEAGLMDGCTRFEVIWRITLPLSLPALASVGLYVFMIAWNEFLFAFMFLDSPEIFTLSRGVVSLNSQEVPRQFLMAGSVIITIPIMVLFFWFERFLVGGLAAGGVKG